MLLVILFIMWFVAALGFDAITYLYFKTFRDPTDGFIGAVVGFLVVAYALYFWPS